MCILQKSDTQVGKHIQDLKKEYSAEKFNSKFSTWWFQIMPEYYDDQILRAKASVKLKIPFSMPTEMSHHDYTERLQANSS
jgi:hypothetical protein